MPDPITSASGAVKTDVAAAAAKDVSFFEKNPKATAIGSAVAGGLIVFLVMHFI